MFRSQRILIVSDEAPSRVIRGALEERGFSVTNASNRHTAYASLLESPFDLVVVDLAQPDSGAEFVGRLRATPKLSETFVLTLAEWGTGQPTLALSQGADAYEPKPIDATRLVSTVERLLFKEKAKTAAAANGNAEIESDE
jgi:DNA-binding response OmpR family regulator